MKHTLKAMILAGLIGTGSLFVATPAEAQHYRGSSVGIYVHTPGVSIGYSRGYYDRYHRWHRCSRYSRYHRCYAPARYYRHDRGHHYGWYRRHHRRDYDRYDDRRW